MYALFAMQTPSEGPFRCEKKFLPIFNSQANCNFFEKNSKLKKKIFYLGCSFPIFSAPMACIKPISTFLERLGLWLSKKVQIVLTQAIGAEKNEHKVWILFFQKCQNLNFSQLSRG